MPEGLDISTKVLVIDHDPHVQRLLKSTLESKQYVVCEAGEGVAGLTEAAFFNPALVVLELDLPDISGVEVIKRLRAWSAASILVLSTRNSQRDIVTALDAGADDYLTKPFGRGELLARLRALRRRQRSSREPALVRFGDVQVDLDGHIVTKAGREIRLTATEFALLNLLISNRGKIVSHQHILRELWGLGHEGNTNYLRVYITRLRSKLEDDPHLPKFLLTASGFGYRLNAEAAKRGRGAVKTPSPSSRPVLNLSPRL